MGMRFEYYYPHEGPRVVGSLEVESGGQAEAEQPA